MGYERPMRVLVAALCLGFLVGGTGCSRGISPEDASATDGPQQNDAVPRDAQPDDVTPDAPKDGSIPDVPSDTTLPDASEDGSAQDGRPDGSQDAEVPDGTADGGCVVNLLANGDFEQGRTVWTEQSSGSYPLIYARADLPSTRPPYDGEWAAWLAGDDGVDDKLFQDVTVPAAATSLRLRGQRSIATMETTSTFDWDKLTILLQDTSGATLETILKYSNLDANTGWAAFDKTLTTSYAGQTVRLLLRATTDGLSNPTSFFIDGLALEANVCP